MEREKILELISQMTLEEKAGLCSGEDFWHTKAVERLSIPAVMVSDGPHGLRKQDLNADHLGINESIKAICFPTACALASSYDRELIGQVGEKIGEECQAENVSVILGPAVNIKRSPLCGRNFEYFSEDPYLTAEMAKAHIKGVQSKNVGTSLKHYLANNQEQRRNTSDSQMDERTLREIYMPAFEYAVKEVQPWTIMCSYNLLNGVQLSENKEMLTDVLRDEWGFEGLVVSDWGAVRGRVKGLEAGLDLEMPSSAGINDALIVQAVKDGSLDEKVLDKTVERILKLVFTYVENHRPDTVWDKEGHHAFARKAAAECAVLLKNENVLPLAENEKVAFIGAFAEKPRYQGGGSSHINSTKVESALEAVKEVADVSYAEGYHVDSDEIDEKLIAEAVALSKESDKVVIFAGLPDSYESEGYDRTHMKMPRCQTMLIEEIAKVQKNVIVVLHNGSPIEMEWADDAAAILEVYLGGQAVGGATVDVLYGKVNPSGHLAETFPLRMEDNPSYLYFGGKRDVVEYREGVFVGYRYYETKKMKVRFPFGHGLSYTTFAYDNMQVSKKSMSDMEEVIVSVDVTNTGSREGKEVVQLYVSDKESLVKRPIKELRAFEKITLAPGQTKTVKFTLGKRAFAYYEEEIKDWYVEEGEYELLIGSSVADIRCRETILVHPTAVLKVKYDDNSTVGMLLENEKTKKIMKPLMDIYEKNSQLTADSSKDASIEAISPEMVEAMLQDMPLRQLVCMSQGEITFEQVAGVIAQLNETNNE